MQAAFDFDAEDLAHNRNGEVSDAQHRRSTNRVANNLAAFLGTLGALVFMFALALVANVTGLPDFDGLALSLLSVVMAIVLIVTTGLGVRLRRLDNDAHDNALRTVEGRIQKTQLFVGYGQAYWVTIDDDRFAVNRAQYQALEDDQPYRVYALGKINHILSVEPAPRQT